MNNHRLRDLPGVNQTGQILVMMKRIAPGPIDQLDIRIAVGAAIIVKICAWPGQHISDPGDRNKIFYRIYPLRQCGQRQPVQIISHPVHRRIANTHPPAGTPDLAQHCGQHNACPHGLFTIGLTGQRPA